LFDFVKRRRGHSDKMVDEHTLDPAPEVVHDSHRSRQINAMEIVADLGHDRRAGSPQQKLDSDRDDRITVPGTEQDIRPLAQDHFPEPPDHPQCLERGGGKEPWRKPIIELRSNRRRGAIGPPHHHRAIETDRAPPRAQP
jgi:hypothetical protein